MTSLEVGNVDSAIVQIGRDAYGRTVHGSGDGDIVPRSTASSRRLVVVIRRFVTVSQTRETKTRAESFDSALWRWGDGEEVLNQTAPCRRGVAAIEIPHRERALESTVIDQGQGCLPAFTSYRRRNWAYNSNGPPVDPASVELSLRWWAYTRRIASSRGGVPDLAATTRMAQPGSLGESR